MSALLDVSLLVAVGWSSHPQHVAARAAWKNLPAFATCTATQMGFLRVSLSPAFRASFANALGVLGAITARPLHRFLTDETVAFALPAVASRQDVTDAHLVVLARKHGLPLLTLDGELCKKSWASDIARLPFQVRP